MFATCQHLNTHNSSFPIFLIFSDAVFDSRLAVTFLDSRLSPKQTSRDTKGRMRLPYTHDSLRPAVVPLEARFESRLEDSTVAIASSMITKATLVHMKSAEYDEATEILTRTLRMLLAKLRTEAKPEIFCHERTFTRPLLRFSWSESTDFFIEPPRADQGCQKIFRSPINVQNGDELLPGPETYDTLSFVVIYNLALSWHLKATTTDVDHHVRVSVLWKALALYEYATKILANGVLNGDPLPSMALASNMGALCLDLGCAKRSKAYQAALLSTILCCVDGKYNFPNYDSLLDGFLANALHDFVRVTAPVA